MKIVGLMAARNEDWILGLSARAALMWLDALVLLDHASTDETPRICCQVQASTVKPVEILYESDPTWAEMQHRQRMLCVARQMGATHIVYIDADEILTGNLLSSVRALIESCPATQCLELPWLQMRSSINFHCSAGLWSQQNASFAFVDSPGLHWAARDGYDFHQRPPMGRAYFPFRPLGHRNSGLMHLQMVNGRRLRAKQALYQMTEILRWPGRETVDQIRRKYSLTVYGRDGPPPLNLELERAPQDWWQAYEYAGLMEHLTVGALPWQEAEIHRLLAEHGPAKFAGLDLFGIDEPERLRR